MKQPVNGGITRRETNRWLMAIYDTLLYAICWIGVFCIYPGMEKETVIYAAVGYVLFMGSRFLFDVYKMIVRYGAVNGFARLICADAAAAVLLVASNLVIEKILNGPNIPTVVLACTVAAFAIVSVAARVIYCYMFRFAARKSKTAKLLRQVLERLALVDFDSNVSGATLHLVLESRETMPTYINELQWIVDKFAIRGKVQSIKQVNNGYINRTYRIETLSENNHIHKYILQRINTNVFKDPDTLMENYKLVTRILYGKLKLHDKQERNAVQELRITKDGRPYLRDDSGCWRMTTFFDGVYSMDIPRSPEVFGWAGYAFGRFIRALEDVEIEKIKEVIPNFHNTKSRYEALEESIKTTTGDRVPEVQKEIEFIRARADKYGMISDALDSGEIPLRICHNDCNLNNILFDNKTDLPVAIIDLDTVMPSSPLYDFGDSMRIGTNTAKDDEKDLSKVSCDLNMYEHYARGYLKACGDVLTKRELELLPYAALIITSEDGIRFLKDHIDGDTYYTITYPGQNLDRARTQLKLVEDMEQKLPQIKNILRGIYAEMGLEADISD